jgi:hypothetical protein
VAVEIRPADPGDPAKKPGNSLKIPAFFEAILFCYGRKAWHLPAIVPGMSDWIIPSCA